LATQQRTSRITREAAIDIPCEGTRKADIAEMSLPDRPWRNVRPTITDDILDFASRSTKRSSRRHERP